MKKLFEKYKNLLITHPNYSGYVCGYNDVVFYLALEKRYDLSYRKLPKEVFILEEFKDAKFTYIAENENEIEKQFNIINNG